MPRVSGTTRQLSAVRRSMLRQTLITCCEIYPGSREYRRHARSFMPLQVRLGQDVDSFASVTWQPGLEANGFFLILGASGSGKTETLKLIGRQLIEHGIPVLVLDFHGDVRVPGLSSVLMSSGTASWAGVNPMEIDSGRAEQVGLYDQRMTALKGVGEKKAQAIIAYRKAHGPFASLEQFEAVPGIGPSIIAKNKSMIVFR